jgi:hypothetical protein
VWHTPQVNKDKVWRGYVDSYDDHAFGILQEDGQNSFDAYLADVLAKEMKVVIKYDADKRVLYHRDFKTSGMGHCRECHWGIRDGSVECTNSECGWGCFHNMGYSGKGGMALGSRGMGKALQLLAGDRMVVRTTLPDGRHQASLWERVRGDWQWRFAPEFDQKLSSPGTELMTFNVVDRVHGRFLETEEIVSELQERWFRLLEQGAKIEYILVRNGRKKRVVVKAPRTPELDKTQGLGKARLTRRRVIVKYQGQRLGELRNLTIFLAAKPFKQADRSWGIAIVKNGKQTITRFKEFPEEIPERIRKRVFGYCDAICTREEPFLQDAENAQHTGYQWSHTTYKAVRRELRAIVREFVQPFLRAGGERVTEKEQKEAMKILEVLNKALEAVPEFGLFGKEGISRSRKVETSTKDYIYLSRIELENRSYSRGEIAQIRAVIKNPTPREVLVKSTFEHFDPTPVVVEFGEEGVVVPPGTPEKPGTKSVDWQVSFERDQAPGVHWIQVALHDVKGQPLTDDEADPIRMRRHLYCELEPRRITRTRSGTGSPKDERGTGGGEGAFGLAAIQWFKKPDLRDSVEAYVDMTQAVAFVNLKGRRLEFARSISKNRKGYWPVVAEVISEKMLEIKAGLDAGEKEEWQAEEVKNKMIELEQLKAKLLRKVVEQLA